MYGWQHCEHTLQPAPDGFALGWQKFGQMPLPHLTVSFSAGHALPPPRGDTHTDRVLVFVPSWQFMLHADHVDHSLTTQSRGRGQFSIVHCSHCDAGMKSWQHAGQTLQPVAGLHRPSKGLVGTAVGALLGAAVGAAVGLVGAMVGAEVGILVALLMPLLPELLL